MAHFFGRIGNHDSDEPYEKIIMEQVFNLHEYGDMSIKEAWNLPVGLRRWWLQRLAEEREKQKKEAQGSTPATSTNAPNPASLSRN